MTYYNLVYSQGRGVQIMNKRSILIICLILCVICSISVAAAADMDANATHATQQDFVQTTEVNDVSVNDTLASSNNPDKLNAEPDSFTQLQDDISGSDHITLDHDYNFNSADDSGKVEGIVIARSMTIEGGNIVIDAKNQARIFKIMDGCSVTLNGITFKNGNADNGGAIYCAGTLTMNNCKFEDNNATNGGAVYFTSVPDILSNLEFTRNHADNNGGAMYYHADASGTSHDDALKLSKFINNTAGNEGGALYLHGSTGKIESNEFTGNNATNDGGAIMIEGSNWRIDGSTFKSNTAINKRGGAIYLLIGIMVLTMVI